FWRMDFPPLIAVLTNVSRGIFGDSLASVRVFPALEGAVLIALAALIARELGGRRFAQAFAAIAVFASPMIMRTSTLFQPVILDQIWWTLTLYALVRLARTEDQRWWLLVGAALGFGLLTKFSIAFIGIGLLAALLVTSWRRALLTRWPWIAVAIALVIGAPSIVGQIRLGFPVVGQMHDLQSTQLMHVTWLSFIEEQPLLIGPVSFIVAVVGAVALVWNAELRAYRVAGLSAVFAFVLLFLLHGKSYYAGPIYPMLLAGGAVVVERVRRPTFGTVLRVATLALVIVLGVVALPIGMPILSPEATASYAARLGVGAAVRTNRGNLDRLPQDYADMLGWEEQSQALRAAYRSLTPDEQRDAVIVGNNYGEAGAAEFYRRRYGLPPVVSTAGSYWFFGPGERPGKVVISIGETADGMRRFFGDVRPFLHLMSPWSVSEERSLDVIVSREPKTTLQAIWAGESGRQ
ncbi:MAG TPA: glycosyltransferase family 39 protein, partial [Gemmatimonadaceae bacterium]